MLRHQRLGHIKEKDLQVIHIKSMVEGISNYSLDFYFYEYCIYGKKKRVRFPFSEMRVEGILQWVHSDVFGPISFPSLGKFVHYVSFIDEFLRNTCIYFLKKKY
jgi:hypothetical protein